MDASLSGARFSTATWEVERMLVSVFLLFLACVSVCLCASLRVSVSLSLLCLTDCLCALFPTRCATAAGGMCEHTCVSPLPPPPDRAALERHAAPNVHWH